MLGARQDGSRLVAIEVERKFLVAGEGWRSNVAAVRRFRQFYLVGEGKANIRVRIEDDARAWLTIKSAAHGRIRDEFEYSIPLPDALEMSRMAEGWIIEKTRHIVPYEGHDWEVDVFSGDNLGLVIAEVELASANERFDLPCWAGDEVTDDRRYYNASLAHCPFRQWPRS
jgi:adenylate cyclase